MWYANYNIISTFHFEQTVYIYGVEPSTLMVLLPCSAVNVCSAASVCLARVNKHYVQVRRVSIEGELIAPMNFAAVSLRVLRCRGLATRWRQSASDARPGF